MSAKIDILNPTQPKRVLMVASNKAKSETTGWDIGVWAAELVHPWYEFTEHGYEVEIVSPEGGALYFDALSDPRDPSEYSAHDLLSMGFLNTPKLMALIQNTRRLDEVDPENYAAVFLCGGQGPMYTFINNEQVHHFFASFYEAGKPAAVICHGTCILLKTRLSNGKMLIEGKTWTGFADSEEDYADTIVGKKLQPFRIEEEARKIPNHNYINGGRFKAFAVRDGNLITGQQQYSGSEAAKLVIQALGQ